MSNEEIDKAAREYAEKHSSAPDKETPDWIINDFKAGAKWAMDLRWIPVSERLPIYNQRVLTYNPTNEISDEEVRMIMFGSVSGGFPSSVTHWMELPKPPVA